jgi:hypothetical protein
MAEEGFLLLALPDPCRLRVLQCCAADDHRSLFSAARAHSKLHQAAVVALRSITLHVSQQQQIDGVMVYLGKHHQHVDSFELVGAAVPSTQIRQLPEQLQLTSLQLERLFLQLKPAYGFQGVLGAAASPAALKQLRLSTCHLLGSGAAQVLAAALSQLPAGLEHLTICELYCGGQSVPFPAGMLQQLQHLTYLQLGEVDVVGPDEASPTLQPLQALTRLVGLKLDLQDKITSSMLSGMQHLTRLELVDAVCLEPGALAGKTQMQHLCLVGCKIAGDAAGEAQLLSHLQPLQQLTHLTVESLLEYGSNTPASAYAALTASSKLQHLDISRCTLPAGVWQHMFPTSRQLPNLQSLCTNYVEQPPGVHGLPPEGSRLVSCCPGLQTLKVCSLQCIAELLASLQGLSGLQTLQCDWEYATSDIVQAVCQRTGLRELCVWDALRIRETGLFLPQLKQLTSLQYHVTRNFADEFVLSGEVHTVTVTQGSDSTEHACILVLTQQHQAGLGCCLWPQTVGSVPFVC